MTMRSISVQFLEGRGRVRWSNARLALLVVAAVAVALPAVGAAAVTPRLSSAWVTNASVDGVVAAGKTVYIRGRFTYVGPNSGSWVELDPVSGALRRSPRITGGSVVASVSDGAGGLFVGGSFSAVDGVARKGLAHVQADGSLDLSWNPNASWDLSNDSVFALAVSGQTVYVGGDFDSIGGQMRSAIAALDARTGKATAWNPEAQESPGLDCNGVYCRVTALAVSGPTVYAGGSFGWIGGQRRNGIAALDARTGKATAWNDHAPSNTDVWTLAVAGQTVYAGGLFSSIGGQHRESLAALDARTGKATAWNPNHDDMSPFIDTLAVRGSTVYVGGDFDSIGGQRRHDLAAVDTHTGKATAWNPSPNGAVWTLAVSRSSVYVGGEFSSVGGQRRYFIAAVHARTGRATAWNPHADNKVRTVAVSGGAVYVGGAFNSVGGQTRRFIAALDARTGRATAWNPRPDNEVSALAVSGQTVYVGGKFTSIGGQTRPGIAALDARTGRATAWNPDASLSPELLGMVNQVEVWALAVSGNTIYVSGSFGSIGGQPRDEMAALDARTGQATAWKANANGGVDELWASGPTVYMTGNFSSIGGQTRDGIAALDARTGKATAWDPKPTGDVVALAVSGSTIYVGGSFTSIGGQHRHDIAALDGRTGRATSWNPRPDNHVQALAVSGRTVYVGGYFQSIGGQTRDFIAAVDTRTGKATAWNPRARYTVGALAVARGNVYIGANDLVVTPALK